MEEKIEIIEGGKYSDNRGNLFYFNDFRLDLIKRFYIIEHPNTTVIRAWQGHQREQKWFYVLSGSFNIIIVKPDNWELPADNLDCKAMNLESNNKILHVPGGYVTGFKANIPFSKIMIFSDLSIEESLKDDFRFDKNKWYKW